MSRRNTLALALILISFGLLALGLTLPALTMTVSSKAVTPMGGIEGQVLDKTRSVLGTVRDLYLEDKNLVASLILCFGVVVPIAKGVMLLVALKNNPAPSSRHLVSFVKRIGKWSMADVMVVAILLSYLSTSYQEDSIRESLTVFGTSITVDLSTMMVSSLQPGFYWFLSYCIVSLVPLELMKTE